MSSNQVVDDVFGTIAERAESKDTLSISDLLEAFGERTYGPVLFIVGVIAASPLGAIPGASVFFATIVIILAAQYAVKSGSPWLPSFLKDRSIEADRVKSSLDTCQPYAKKLEFLFAERAVALTRSPWKALWAAILIAMACLMYPLALIPGGVTAPALAIALMGVSITARDGRALAISAAFGAAAVVFGLWLIL